MAENIAGKPRIRAPNPEDWTEVESMLREERLNTICESASCPNLADCWKRKHASFMILGSMCSRSCTFCDVPTGKPQKVDIAEPIRVARAVNKLGLRHVVVTSVTRDDLADGGAEHFAHTIHAIRHTSPDTTVEVLTPDFRRKGGAINKVIEAKPDVFAHNIETVPRLYKTVRLGASYEHSLELLKFVASKGIVTKSSIIIGFGENVDEIVSVMKDLRDHGVNIVTFGQYLRPSEKHHPVVKYHNDDDFAHYRALATEIGFEIVVGSPLSRTSYYSEDDVERLRSLLSSV